MAASSMEGGPEPGPAWAWEWRRNRIHPFAPPATEGPSGPVAQTDVDEAEVDEDEQAPVEYSEMEAFLQKEYP